jgi:hypothetical protein
MRRPLALLAAVLGLSARVAQAEPLDFELSRLGAPKAGIWETAAGLSTADATQAAIDSNTRFARYATDLLLAFTSPLLEPASTTGYSGFDVSVDGAWTQVNPQVIGTGVAEGDQWPTGRVKPQSLFVGGLHVRKALPYSFELGGRFSYLAQSLIFGGTLEARWALTEGFSGLPDLGVRAAYTRVFAQAGTHFSATELDLMVSKRFGMNAVLSLTPYAAGRFTFTSASSDAILFDEAAVTPAQIEAGSAAYASVSNMLYRTTLGCRMTSYAVSLAAEVGYFGGGTFGKSGQDTAKYSLSSSWNGAVKFGFEF